MRILVYRLGSLGDTILALPCFHLIRQAYPDAEITVLTNAPVSGKAAPLESILESTGLIDGVIYYPLGLRDLGKLFDLCRKLRAQKFDLGISLAAARGRAASVRDLLFFKACGIRRVIGIPFEPRDLVPSQCEDGTLFESEAERLLRRVAALDHADLSDPHWIDLKLTTAEKSEAARLLEPMNGKFIAASLGTKTPLNDWGAANWKRLLGELSGPHPGLGLVLLGSRDEYESTERLRENWSGPFLNLCGATSPRVSAAVLNKATLFLGHDSGPMHLAAAAGTPCVAIFSARCPPGQWFPIGKNHALLYPLSFYDPTRIADPQHQRNALDSITVEAVRRAAESVLGQ